MSLNEYFIRLFNLYNDINLIVARIKVLTDGELNINWDFR